MKITRKGALLDRQVCLILFFATVLFLMLNSLIPPFKSLDEQDHLKRAYLLSKGALLLTTPAGTDSGGYIDSGLLEYQDRYLTLTQIEQPSAKITLDYIEDAKRIEWSGDRVFSYAPGTGFYFPLAYLPQASALFIGEHLGLSIHDSYNLARLLTFLASVLVVVVAFRLYPPNLLTLALLLVPMTLFQFVSTSLDSITIALSSRP